jgi:pyruvate dehydrogenase (quinone)
VRGAHDDVIALAEQIGAPIGHTLRGKEHIQYDNPFDVGMTGLLGYGAFQSAMDEADLLLLLGTDFPYDQFLPAGVRTAQVEIDPTRLGRRTRMDLAVVGDVGETVRALLPLVGRKKHRKFLESALKKHHKAMTGVIGAYTKDVEHHTPIHPEYAAVVLDEEAAEDAVFTVDTGMGNVWAARYLTPNGKRRVIGSFLHGSMANALPHAIGAAFAARDDGAPQRHVVAIAGDGGLSMLLGELVTLVQYQLPVKIVLFDNATLGMVRAEMLVDGLPSFGTDSPAIDYAAVASAMGIPSVRVTDPTQIRTALREAFSHDGPALVDLVTDPRALSLPPKITRKQVTGFTAAMSKEILGGGMGEVMAMARSNLRNVPRP